MAYSLISVSDLTELKTRRGNSTNTTMATIMGLFYPIIEAFSVYVWDNTSTATGDDNEIVHPTTGSTLPGRWYKVDLDTIPQLNSDWNATSGVTSIFNKPINLSSFSNDQGFITGYIETDPTVPAFSKSLTGFSVIKNSTDALYEPILIKKTAFNKDFGITSSTVTEGNDSRVLNGQTSFGWGNHASAGYLYITTASSTYQPIGNYITSSSTNTLTNKSGNISQWTNDSGYLTSFTESDPTVPAYSKSLNSFSVIKSSTDTLYRPISYVPAFIDITSKPTTISGYGIIDFNSLGDGRWSLLGHVHTFTSLTSKPTTLSGYGITDAYPLTGNPSNFLTTFTETDPTVPAYSKTLSAFSVIKSSTDSLYKAISYTPTSLEITTSLGFIPYNSSNPSSYINQAGARNAISLTTTGTGVSTYNNSTGVLNIPTPVIPNDYTNTSAVAGGAGNVTFYLTSDKTSTGTALYSNVNFVCPLVNDSTQNYTYSWSAYNPATKSITVNVKVSTGLVVALVGLTLLGVPANVPNGTNVQILVKGT